MKIAHLFKLANRLIGKRNRKNLSCSQQVDGRVPSSDIYVDSHNVL